MSLCKSLDIVRNFSKKTGDPEIICRAHIGIIALTNELECEHKGGDWRLRQAPGQTRMNGLPPLKSLSLKHQLWEMFPDRLTRVFWTARQVQVHT